MLGMCLAVCCGSSLTVLALFNLMIPSEIKLKILAKRAKYDTLGSKGLN